MESPLARIIAEKHREVERLKKGGIPRNLEHGPSPPRDFRKAISLPDRINLIAEIKFASPSAGVIRKGLDPLSVGRVYEEAGAAAISLLTDKRFFGGDLTHLPRLKEAVSLPILRKDFIVDEIQVRESFLWGADAILLIARILDPQRLETLLEISQTLGMAALMEVHDEDDLNKAVDCGAEIIGINNRNLDTFEVSLETTLRLAPRVPEGHVRISESGIHRIEDIESLRPSGVQAILVGTGLMKSQDMGKKVRELAGASTSRKD
jgi:indole-3-glycerol phosphate synthase